jgi:Tfp pilus assembly protein PilO
MKKTQLTRQQMLAVGLAVFGLVLGLGSYMILVAPQKSKAIALSGAVNAAQSSLYVLRHHPHAHVQKPKPPAVEAADLFRLTKAMPDSPDVPGILLSLMRLAQASSVELITVQPPVGALTQTPTGYTGVPVSVTLHGKFANIASFLQRLRDSVVVNHGHLKVTNRLFVPSLISLTTDDAQTVSATLSLVAFVYGTPPAPVVPATTGTTATTTTTTTTGAH